MTNVDSLKIASKFLKSEREKRGITIEEVSFELKLEKKLIIDIENRNFKNFNSYLFLRGYLLNYAEFLNVDINLSEKEDKKSINFDKAENKYNISKSKKNLKFFAPLLIVFIFILSKLYETDSNNHALNKKETSIINSQESEKFISKEFIENISDDKSINSTSEDKNDIVSDNLTNSINVIKDGSLNKPENNNNDIISLKDKTLIINYSGDSWTEIIDSNGDIVFFDLVKKNNVLELVVEAPFEILLGDATVASIKYNNKDVVIPYINSENNVGKIKVDN